MSALIEKKDERFLYPYVSPKAGVTKYRRETDIERLRQRVETLVKSNEEKEKKIENLQTQLSNCQLISTPRTKSIFKLENDLSDSNSIPSMSSEKDSSRQNDLSSHENPLNKLKLDVLYRASSAEPMLLRELTSTPTGHLSARSSIVSLQYHHEDGYISEGAHRQHSMSKSNLNKSKSSSAKGLKNLLGKLIRNDSQRSLDRQSIPLTIHSSKVLNPLERTFACWTSEQIGNWLYGVGLGQYASECRKAFANGLQLFNATAQDLEKKMGMRNPLHRKKLQLCLNSLTRTQTDGANLDTYWILKWLDDIGLPQYKQEFSESKIDGRLLNHLTLEDLAYLNITNELHHLCFKRSIQLLRSNHFHPNSLKRRPMATDKNTRNEILFWSNHRVMDWLRSIDLAEYAANLRGSGVCGALIILELRFNVSILADILSIPNSKGLLRKHLAMRFQELIGDDLHNRKTQNAQPLALNSKVKISRNGLFPHRRNEELICPLTENHFKLVLPSDSPTTNV